MEDDEIMEESELVEETGEFAETEESTEAAAEIAAEPEPMPEYALADDVRRELDGLRREIEALRSSMAVFVENGATIADSALIPEPVEADPDTWEYAPLSELDYRM